MGKNEINGGRERYFEEGGHLERERKKERERLRKDFKEISIPASAVAMLQK